jgi:peptidoglycan/xylan/chitin deacetylase (PgdA/CDA1 family)
MSLIVSSISTPQQVVALTFDDGPDETDTPRLLDALDEASALATFFIQGSVLNAETREIVVRMAATGHEVGNHTHHHLDLTGADTGTIYEQIARTHYQLDEIIGRPPTLIRPPYGRGADEVAVEANKLGYRATVLWSADASDWTNPQPSSDTIVERVVTGYEHGQGVGPGGIVLLHDGGADKQAGESRRETVDAVRKLVPALRSAGFRLVTVTELLDEGRPA